MQTVSTSALDKLFGLLGHLNLTKTELEMVADEIEDINLKLALNGLSLETEQYICELNAQLHPLGINYRCPPALVTAEEDNDVQNQPDILNNGNEVNNICLNNEHRITTAYREILKEVFPIEGLKNILLFQLNTLKYTFLKVKVLNAVRFAQ